MLGPAALHCHAPDEGNIHLLEQVANPEQKERYLRPLATGEVRSCFAMTEPHPGAGSDPGMLATRAEKDGNGFVIRGRKWLITGAMAPRLRSSWRAPARVRRCHHASLLPNPAFDHRALDTSTTSWAATR
jgi:hypothetical protein